MYKFSSLFALLPLFFLAGCSNAPQETPTDTHTIPPFSTQRWQEKVEEDYPNRKDYYTDLLYSDSLRTLSKAAILDMLGPPDKATDGHLYYLIEQERLGLWPLHSRFLVFKFKADNTVEWIKLHE